MKKADVDAAYLALILDPIRICANYKPKFGQGAKGGGLTLDQFQALYQGDPFYNWFGLDNPMMYASPSERMIAAIGDVGAILGTHFPRAADDVNELPDRLIEL